MTSIKKIFVTALSLALVVPAALSAQEQAQPEMKAVIYADITFGDIQATEDDGELSGSYSIRGNMGQQNDIQLGLVTYDANNLMIDAVPVRTGFSLREGEVATGTFSYDIPQYLSGKVTFVLKTETSEGLPLTAKVIKTSELAGSGRAVTCTEKDATIECVSKIDTSIEVSYGQGSLFSSTANMETKQAKKGQKVTFTPDLSAGKYAAHIKTGNGEAYTLTSFINGTYGIIRNIVVESAQKGEVHGVAVLSTSDSAPTLSVDLGGSCGNTTLPVTSPALEFTIKTSCTEGTLVAKLMGSDGSVLDSETESFSVIPVNAPAAQDSSSMNPIVYGAIALLLAMIGVYAYLRRSGAPSSADAETPVPPTSSTSAPVVAVIAILFLLSGVSKANAASAMLNYICGANPCPLATTIFVDMYDANGGGPYAPGDQKTVTVMFSSDDNPQELNNSCGQTACVSPLARLAVDRPVTASDPDLFPQNYTVQQIRGLVAANYTFTVPSPLGTHYVYYGFGSGGYTYVTGSEAFTAEAYCPWSSSFDPGVAAGTGSSDGGELLVGQSITLTNNPPKWHALCTGKGGATCPPDPEPNQAASYTATCYGPGVTPPPTVNVNFSLLEKMFKVFALGN